MKANIYVWTARITYVGIGLLALWYAYALFEPYFLIKWWQLTK